jgi:hypothetical protein
MWSRGYAWPLAAVSCAVIAAGVALLWVVKPRLGMSVGIPAGATLIASVITWAGSAPPRIGQSTLEQLGRAKQALADRAVDQLCGVARPERNSAALPPSHAPSRSGGRHQLQVK